MKQTSLKSFGNLISKLDQSNATTKKVGIISEFIIDIDPRDGAWVLILLMGNNNKRLITGRLNFDDLSLTVNRVLQDVWGIRKMCTSRMPHISAAD